MRRLLFRNENINNVSSVNLVIQKYTLRPIVDTPYFRALRTTPPLWSTSNTSYPWFYSTRFIPLPKTVIRLHLFRLIFREMFVSEIVRLTTCCCHLFIFIYLFIKNICVCNAQLMQKAQQRRYKTVAAIWTKKFSIMIVCHDIQRCHTMHAIPNAIPCHADATPCHAYAMPMPYHAMPIACHANADSMSMTCHEMHGIIMQFNAMHRHFKQSDPM